MVFLHGYGQENGQSVVNEGSQFPNDENSIDQFFRQMTPDTGMTSDMGGGSGWTAANYTEHIAAIIAIEPGGAPGML